MWVVVWKFVLIFTFLAYSIMFLVVALGGIRDIRRLFQDLGPPRKPEHRERDS